jgi:tRNA(fMet)-specific endonuclease VapC
MKVYLVDTNACIALINGTSLDVRRHFRRAVARRDSILLSSLVAFELWYGVSKSEHRDANRRRLSTFLAGPFERIPFDDDDAREAGAVRAELKTAGRPIGAYDVLLAGQARRRRATLVTSNVREFARVSGLAWEDWAVRRVPRKP